MLTQLEVRARLDVIANEVSQLPGLYYELYSRLFSERVLQWIGAVSPADAELIRRVASEDPDYLPALEAIPAVHLKQNMFFNPAWDFDY